MASLSTLKLRVVQARYGDCLILECGTGKRRKYVLVDGGPGDVYQPNLREELKKIVQNGGQVDLLVLTHIDNDHVVGLLDFMKELKLLQTAGKPWLIPVKRIWHNAFKKMMPEIGSEASDLEEEVAATPVSATPEEVAMSGESSFGVGEGIKLQLAEDLFKIPGNFAFKDGIICIGKNAPQPVRLGSLRLWMIGPNAENLASLREKWFAWLKTQKGEVSFGEVAVAPDDSVNNLSSIMFVAEQSGRRVLMTGDGRSEDIISGLERAGLLQPGGTTHVDVMKVPHHGSIRNCVGDLFDRVLADTYVMSADGHNGNPDWETLELLVDAACRQNRDIKIFATNWTPSLKKLVAERPAPANHYTLAVMEEGITSELL
jgi:beta-lactamase superfamily II metal-dependent hydrolase